MLARRSLNTPLNPFLLWLRSSAFGAFPWVKRVINGFPAARAKIFFEICSAACFPALCVKLLSTQQTLSRSGPTQLFLWCIHSMQHHWKLYFTPYFTSCLSHDLLYRNLRDFECVLMRVFFFSASRPGGPGTDGRQSLQWTNRLLFKNSRRIWNSVIVSWACRTFVGVDGRVRQPFCVLWVWQESAGGQRRG